MKSLILTAFIAITVFSSCEKITTPPNNGGGKKPGDCPEICTDIYDPVCGSDGKTYGNECYARRAGVKSWTKGECGNK